MKLPFPSPQPSPRGEGESNCLLPDGRSDNSPVVHCWVRVGDCLSPAGTDESPPMSCVGSQPSLRDVGCLLRDPTLQRVGYCQISHPGETVGHARMFRPGDGGRLGRSKCLESIFPLLGERVRVRGKVATVESNVLDLDEAPFPLTPAPLPLN